MTNKEIEDSYSTDFLRQWTSIVAYIGEQYDNHTPEEWAGHAISRLHALGYYIAQKPHSRAEGDR